MRPIGAAFDSRRRQRNTLDALVDDYVRWREECAIVHSAYDLWTVSPPRRQRLAHAAYVAALDREGEAAAHYERRIQQAVERR
jgi:hypothetical protein